jgi:hypothetical protein
MVSLVVLVPEADRRGDTSALITMSCSTENQGNSFLLDRLLTTKYPLGVVLMQLAHEMRRRRLLLRARWLPRLQNQEADDLTNDELHHFNPKKRIPVDLGNLGFELMDGLFESGDEYVAELEKVRSAMKLRASEKDSRRRKPLRESDLWEAGRVSVVSEEGCMVCGL